MLVDQKLNDGIAVPFLGRPAMTAPAAARLSLKFGIPIIPVAITRRPNAHFRVCIKQPIDFTPSGETNADIYALTLTINQEIEKFILARPGQWLWLHRRWPRTAPEDKT